MTAARIHRVVLLSLLVVLGADAEAAPDAMPDVARGAYLAAVAACAGCHSPAEGMGPPFSGGRRFGAGTAAVVAPNITPDRATGIGAWSEAAIVAALRDGVRPDGSRLGPPMPQLAYRALRPEDAAAIAAFLRTLPPVAHAVPASRRSIATPHGLPPAALPAHGPSDAGDPVAQGRYLANAVTHCTECHTPGPAETPDFAGRLDAGGRIFATRQGPVVAPPITAASLEPWSDAALAALITEGERPDGTSLRGPMPIAAYAKLRGADLRAIILYLRQR